MDARCCECDREVSYDTGFTMTGGLGDSSQDRIHCPDCAPDTGKGYTLSDLKQWCEDNKVARHQREVAMMELLGPDVYDFMARTKPNPARRLYRTLADMNATLGKLFP